ncbi:MAG: hypothetical protein HRT93_03750 [Piscirickettsiaceae bacterium]|nr:hypothetical protein [Piscirickettsiaceae bacterium]
MIKISLILASIIFSMASSISQAEVISITDPRYDVANSTEGVLRPVRGMSMAQVVQQFGPAEQQGSAVGEPPITRWVYSDFIVFFEFNTVIHSVVPH